MGYRIDYHASGAVLSAVVSGKSKYAARIARDIGAQARERAARRLLIDLRRLDDRVGSLRELLTGRGGPARAANRRIAVLDVVENDRYYVFAEMLARSLGCTLRHFADASSAISWLSRKT
ncbi:MAG: hypothetical protein QOD26_3022 [Betaproteobacteria bacterium]|jgi:hypothetical protein|nr:hypothetical protein [Betaproteobacteria bacterium]